MTFEELKQEINEYCDLLGNLLFGREFGAGDEFMIHAYIAKIRVLLDEFTKKGDEADD